MYVRPDINENHIFLRDIPMYIQYLGETLEKILETALGKK